MDLEHRRTRQGRKRQRLREMHIPNGEEMETVKAEMMDRPCLKNHIATCQEESVSFSVAAEPTVNGKRWSSVDVPSGEEGGEQGEREPRAQSRNPSTCLCRQQILRPKADLKRQSALSIALGQSPPDDELLGGPGAAERWTLSDTGQEEMAALATPALTGRQIAGKADSWPHRRFPAGASFGAASKSDFSLDTLLVEAERDDLGARQRRPSQSSDPEKTARRKMRVYSTDSPSEDSFSSGSLDCESMFTGTLFDDDSKDNDFLSQSFSLDDEIQPPDSGRGELAPAVPIPGAEPEAETKGELAVAVAQGHNQPVAACLEQEKRRFSASELINRLHLSQKKVAQALKLSKSLTGISLSREKLTSIVPAEGPQPPPFLKGTEGRRSAKQKSKSLASASRNSSPKAHRDGLIFDSPPPHTWRTSKLQRRVGSEEEICSQHLMEQMRSRFLMGSILYQEYSNVASDREIQRQKRADTVTEDDDVPLHSKCSSLPLNLRWSQRPARGNAFALWQDIPDVRRSGLLDRMGNERRKLQEAKFELVTSEGSYLHSLTITVEHFQNSRELQECLNAQEKQWLFSKLPEVREVSEKFLQELEERLVTDILNFDVCDIVLAHCPAFRRVYLPYVTNQAYQEQTCQRLLQENPRFPGILAKLEEDQVCQRLPLASFLILPFQRIMRLKMLVENILKRTKQGSQDEESATKAFDKLKKLTQECNSSVQSMKRTEELIHLNNKFHFESKIFPLISQSRWLVKHGELTEVHSQTNNTAGSKFKLSNRPIYLHLFNDCLLLSRKKDTDKFAVFVHAKSEELRPKDLNMKVHGIPGHVFHLQLLGKQHAKQQILLRARTESEKQRWITAMLLSEREKVTEQMDLEQDDSPQVQCIKTYKPQEADELALEKADVLEVKTRTKDGWVEGMRLSDGERGWFPESHVEEITNRNARIRNLREKNRIKHATRKLQEEGQ